MLTCCPGAAIIGGMEGCIPFEILLGGCKSKCPPTIATFSKKYFFSILATILVYCIFPY